MVNPLHAPWRMEYIAGPKKDGPCIFCRVREAGAEERSQRLVVCCSERAFVMLNRYPYTAGHLLVMPYAHVGRLDELDDADFDALFRLVRASASRLEAAVACEGLNIGVNQGSCAGASVREHVHVQIVPRWHGDNNFMPVLADSRVIPQALDETLSALRPSFADLDRGAAASKSPPPTGSTGP